MDYRYYTDPEYPGIQWRYRLTADAVRYNGEVRQDDGPWITATTDVIDHAMDLLRKETT